MPAGCFPLNNKTICILCYGVHTDNGVDVNMHLSIIASGEFNFSESGYSNESIQMQKLDKTDKGFQSM